RIGKIDCAVHQALVDSLLEWPELKPERGAGDAVGPRDQPARRVEARGEPVVAGRPVESVAHVVLARPDDLYRNPHRLRHEYGLRDEVRLQPAPEPAAREHGVDPDLLLRQAGEIRGDALRIT